jgi:hypothetical protein
MSIFITTLESLQQQQYRYSRSTAVFRSVTSKVWPWMLAIMALTSKETMLQEIVKLHICTPLMLQSMGMRGSSRATHQIIVSKLVVKTAEVSLSLKTSYIGGAIRDSCLSYHRLVQRLRSQQNLHAMEWRAGLRLLKTFLASSVPLCYCQMVNYLS